jgi:hypothetical protein
MTFIRKNDEKEESNELRNDSIIVIKKPWSSKYTNKRYELFDSIVK